MFDMKAEFGFNLQSPEGVKKIVVRFPTDVEFTEWRRKKKIIQKDVAGSRERKTQIEPSKPQAFDLALVNAIRIDEETGPQIDEAEAYHIINQLADTEVTDYPERDGNVFVIRLKVMGRMSTAHRLRVPWTSEQFEYERMRSGVTFGQYGRQEIRIFLAAAEDLYGKLKQSVEGYKNDIPIVHKAEVINVLLQALKAEEQPELDDDEDQDL